MRKNISLLDGPIFPSLTGLAIPIMATSMVQMAYNMVDMIWIGRIGSNAVAAIGAAGMYMWLANGIATLSRIGGQIKVAQSIGAGHNDIAVDYAKSALQLGILSGLLFGFISILFANPLIGFFNLNSPQVIADAKIYLQITCGGVLFSFLNQIFSGIMTAMGNSRTSFFATATGLIINLIIDPLLIFGIGPFPHMGVVGAGIATIFAQAVVTSMFLLSAVRDEQIFRKIRIFSRPHIKSLVVLIKVGLPTSIQSVCFTGISMILARLVADFGDAAVAIQKVGSQIESISWMTAEGFASAVNAFVAQNHGAGNTKRVKKGYAVSMSVVSLWGVLCTALLLFLPIPIFRLFIPDPSVLDMGVNYLKILSFSQLFSCVEIATAGAFAGLGKTIPPSVVGISLTLARIPMAMMLIQTPLSLNGIWWSVTISSVLKGVVLFTLFIVYFKKHYDRK